MSPTRVGGGFVMIAFRIALFASGVVGSYLPITTRFASMPLPPGQLWTNENKYVVHAAGRPLSIQSHEEFLDLSGCLAGIYVQTVFGDGLALLTGASDPLIRIFAGHCPQDCQEPSFPLRIYVGLPLYMMRFGMPVWPSPFPYPFPSPLTPRTIPCIVSAD